MKQLMLLSMLGGLLAGGVAAAQDSVPAPDVQIFLAQADAQKADSRRLAETAKVDADDAKVRAQLEEARRKLDEAARQVAELSMQLGHHEGGPDVMFFNTAGPRRAVLGVQIDPDSGKEGARVLKVSPGGAAEQAGLADGDVITALDGKAVAGSQAPGRVVVDYMRDVQPDQKVKVKVLRAGKNKEFVVVARPPMMVGRRAFNIQVPDGGGPGFAGAMPEIHTFTNFWQGEFGGMELASITPKLGAYFGATEGVLVVQAPGNAAFKLEDGDVILTIDGRKPDDGAHALRILRSYKSGEKLNMQVLRQRKTLTVAVVMPDRPGWDGDILMPAMPAMPAVPPMPPSAPVPGTSGSPGGPTTLD